MVNVGGMCPYSSRAVTFHSLLQGIDPLAVYVGPRPDIYENSLQKELNHALLLFGFFLAKCILQCIIRMLSVHAVQIPVIERRSRKRNNPYHDGKRNATRAKDPDDKFILPWIIRNGD